MHKKGKFNEATTIYAALLNQHPFEQSLQFLMADVFIRQEMNGLAINLLSNLLRDNPKNSDAWCNLGIAFRKENFYKEAKSAYLQAIKNGKETVEICSNMAGLYADRAQPEEALKWCDKALKIDPNNVSAKWQKALAVLTMRKWEEGWRLYESRQLLESWDSRDTIDCPIWDGRDVNHLYIHGEQGVGDEVMFASNLTHVTNAKNVTIEVNPKVEKLIKLSFPNWNVITKEAQGDYDAKIAIGSLCNLYGKFNDAPYLKPDPERVAFYRSELKKLGEAPYIAVTWLGGLKATRVEDRSISVKSLKPILDEFTCVSAQYNSNPVIEQERLEVGLHKINDECVGGDLAEQAALFAAVDAVVTVQQTAVHVAGAVGAKTYAMIGEHPHWRYGLDGNKLPWYRTVELFRQKSGAALKDVVNDVLLKLKNDFNKI